MKRVFALLTGLMFGTSALAGPCAGSTDADIDLFEKAKAAFLAADYEAFVDIAGPYFPDLKQNFGDYFGQIQVVFPNAFDRCQTVLQRREAPGFYQDLILYFPKGSEAPMAMLLVAAEVDGAPHLVEFTYNTSLSEVMADLK